MNDLLGGLLTGLGFTLFSNLFKIRGGFDTPDFSKIKPRNKSKPQNVPGKKGQVIHDIIKGNKSKKSVSMQEIDNDPFGSLKTPDDVKEKIKFKKK